MNNIDAIGVSSDIKATYRRYLQSLLSVRDPKLNAALKSAINDSDMLDKGPFLEATPPYAAGSTIQSLIEDGVLASSFKDLASNALPIDRPLYTHQEQAIRKISNGRNIVVATGTGSGKTESFMIPILDSIIREKELGTLGPGVRALLLYPMNALANDQLKRLRQLLAEYPEITFGRYTGDTPESPAKAREIFSELNIGEPQLSNELLSREEMRSSPPHILLTNYAMLEYLLLRPQDLGLFTENDNTWRFIVVDEAHVYDGSQGAEVAMLLRRARDRVAPGKNIQCIATSATVGGRSDPGSVTKFASHLFGQPFEWIEGDSARQDLITARKVSMPTASQWGPLSALDYIKLVSAADIESAILSAARSSGYDAKDAYTALLHEGSLLRLRDLLITKPLPVNKVAHEVFKNQQDATRGLAALVSLGSAFHSPEGTSAISARYHLFLRATEGAFACFSESGPHVQLARHDKCPDCNSSMFELGTCSRCSAVHIIGSIEKDGRMIRFQPRKAQSISNWLVFTDEEFPVDEDEEAVVDEEFNFNTDEAKLCIQCGSLTDKSDTACTDCGYTKLKKVRKLKQRGEEIAGCVVCGTRGPSTVRVFETGSDASGAVIATSLYQNLPTSPNTDEHDLPGEGRKLLAFSDSRQAAAYFAPYLESSYSKLQRRRLLAIGMANSDSSSNPLMIEDLVYTVRKIAEKYNVFHRRMTTQQQAREVAPWAMAEIVSTDDRHSLEGLGLMSVLMDRNPKWLTPRPLLELGLNEDECWSLLQELIRTLRQQGAVTMPEDVDANHEIFQPRLGPIFARAEGPEAKKKVLSWLPGKGTNRRISYMARILKALGRDDDPEALLRGIWNYLISVDSGIDWLKPVTQKSLGVVYQVDHELMRLSWVTAETTVYQCSVCKRVTPNSVRNVCPAINCEGSLEQLRLPEPEKDIDHYRSLYRSMNPIPLKTQEHTAQWTNVEAASIQHQFVKGKVNILSCSTTFELGVDVGELQAVFLRNMPPTTSNYVQRAGRAGRRSGSAALVVTYANRRSHDLSQFATPEIMMSGDTRSPYIPLENTRISRRHTHSVVLAAFFRWYLDNFSNISRTAGDFFLPDKTNNEAPVNKVKDYLDPVPNEIRQALLRILPSSVANDIGVFKDAWVPDLLRLLEEVRQELASDVSALEDLQVQAANDKKYKLADRYAKVSATLEKRDLLGFLGTRNILPKYGFPVDTVELKTAYSGNQMGGKIDLTRDLSQAIYEYAPDSTLVAGGMLWTARGIYRMTGRDLEQFEYHVCSNCEGYWQALTDLDSECPHCHEVTTKAKRRITIPVYGFVAEKSPEKPGPRPPRRSWHGSSYILKVPDEVKTRELALAEGTCVINVGSRGRLVAVADGPSGGGFWICTWCGSGAAKAHSPHRPPAHDHLLTGKPCNGSSESLDLAHNYETDLCLLDIRMPIKNGDGKELKSALYAILEAACDELEIARNDIGGSLHPSGPKSWSIVLFDKVPGGAGHVLLVEENMERVLKAALKRVSSCECGEETSCYGCLRSYENQRDHDEISRGSALRLLHSMLT
ncbi:DEAD/DEAH box helicase [Candidatus Saccharibacteria bacterium]|nr:DEAD/DEAH box helicase [Candidatus Saccharibacteria bacterium]